MVDGGGQASIRRVFSHGFAARDLTESLVSFAYERQALEVKEIMARYGFDVVGVSQDGRVSGYIEAGQLGAGICGEYIMPFSGAVWVEDSLSFAKLIRVFAEQDYVFVTVFGQVGGIITRTDLQKAPMRMWLFGMVTIIEMEFSRQINDYYPADSWQDNLTPARLAKATALLAERRRINQQVDLSDCLQFSDKGRILVKDKEARRRLGFKTAKAAKEAIKQIEYLRNNLAHSQDIITYNWSMIINLAGCLDQMFRPVG